MQEEPLSGWKSIADHLGVAVRTAQRLEKEGLPVHRPAGGSRGRKGTVFAFPSKLNDWVRRREGLARLSARRNRLLERLPVGVRGLFSRIVDLSLSVSAGNRPYILLFGAALILALATVGLMQAFQTSQPLYSVEVKGDRLLALDQEGKVLWTYQWEQEIRRWTEAGTWNILLTDLNGNGRREVLAVLSPNRFEPHIREKVVCLDANGSVLWEYFPGNHSAWGGRQYVNQYSIRIVSLIDADVPAQKRIVVVANHVPYYPSQTSILNSEGELVGEYWHTGYVFTYATADLDGDGTPELLLGGINNLFGKPFLAVVPLDIRDAISPAPPAFAPGLESGKELAYRLFPRTDVSRELNLDSRVVVIRVTPEGVLLVDIQLRREPFAPGRIEERVYQIGPDFSVQRLVFPRPFIAFHDDQHREGPHALGQSVRTGISVYRPSRWGPR